MAQLDVLVVGERLRLIVETLEDFVLAPRLAWTHPPRYMFVGIFHAALDMPIYLPFLGCTS